MKLDDHVIVRKTGRLCIRYRRITSPPAHAYRQNKVIHPIIYPAVAIALFLKQQSQSESSRCCAFLRSWLATTRMSLSGQSQVRSASNLQRWKASNALISVQVRWHPSSLGFGCSKSPIDDQPRGRAVCRKTALCAIAAKSLWESAIHKPRNLSSACLIFSQHLVSVETGICTFRSLTVALQMLGSTKWPTDLSHVAENRVMVVRKFYQQLRVGRQQ